MDSTTQPVTITLESSAHRALLALLEREDMQAGLSIGERKALKALKDRK